jgi:hypothetical protein
MNIRRIARALAAVILFAPAGAVGAQCKGETAIGREVVMKFATTSSGTRPAGVPVVSTTQVRLLTNTADAATCQQLYSIYMGQRRNPETLPNGRTWSYYQVGDLYYVVVHNSPAPAVGTGYITLDLSWIPIIIVNRSFQVVAVVAQ